MRNQLLIMSVLIAWLATLVSSQAYLRRQNIRALKGPGGGPKDGGPGPKGGGPGPINGGPKGGGPGPGNVGPKGKGKSAKKGGPGPGPKGTAKKSKKAAKKKKSKKKGVIPIPPQCPPLQPFTASVLVNIVGNPNNVTSSDITTLKSGFRNTYNSLSFDYCDPSFRFVTSVSTETENGVQVIPRGGNMFSLWFLVKGQCRNCNPNTVTLFSPPASRRQLTSATHHQEQRFALASESPFGNQIEMEVSAPGIRKGIIILPFLSPTVAPVEAPRSNPGSETLLIPKEITLLQPRVAPRPATPSLSMAPSPTPPTILYFETNCTCLSSSPKNRAPTESEFANAYNYFLRGSGIYRPFLRAIDSVTEIAPVQCSSVIERFTVYVSVEFFGNINFVKPAEKILLEQSFMDTYNGLIASRCDAPTFRMVTSVGLQSQMKDPSVRGAFIYIFKVGGTCHGSGCSSGLTLFDGAARMLLSAISHSRALQSTACYCPVFNPASGAPTAADFQARFGEVVLDLFHSFQLQNLDASGNVAEVTLQPSSAPTAATVSPTVRPTETPTVAPTPSPTTVAPTITPTILQTPMPTKIPTNSPSTVIPGSLAPTTPVSTITPTALVTMKPTRPKPTSAPTQSGTGTGRPTVFGSTHLPTSQVPSSFPTAPVTVAPTMSATTAAPTVATKKPRPTKKPVRPRPTKKPVRPSKKPTRPTKKPIRPTKKPVRPTKKPVRPRPTTIPPSSQIPSTLVPTVVNASFVPSIVPSNISIAPTVGNGTQVPTAFHSVIPSTAPSVAPVLNGTTAPTRLLSEFPSSSPSRINGTVHPSVNRTQAPVASEHPSSAPSILPAGHNGTQRPTAFRSSEVPSSAPSRINTSIVPTRLFSDHPSASPSKIGGATTLPSANANASEFPSQAPSKRQTTSPSKSAFPTITAIPTGASTRTGGPSKRVPTSLPVTSEFPSFTPSTLPSKLVPGSSQPISRTTAPSKASGTPAPSKKAGTRIPSLLSSEIPSTTPSTLPSKGQLGSVRPTIQTSPTQPPHSGSDVPSTSPSIVPSVGGGGSGAPQGGTGPSAPVSPVSPTAPASPVAPSAPTAPVSPSAPTSPVSPSSPSAPSAPIAPSAPSAPAAPSAPTKARISLTSFARW